jgi:glycosyltransferase involved in cell wall biosynthesis
MRLIKDYAAAGRRRLVAGQGAAGMTKVASSELLPRLSVNERRPRILYVWQGRFPWEVRVEKVCLALAEAGCDVTILARGGAGQRPFARYRRMRIVRVGSGLSSACSAPVSANPIWLRALMREAERRPPDLVIAREIMLAEAAARVCSKHGVPLVIDMAEHYPATMRAFRKYQRNPVARFAVFTARIPDRVERRSVQRADAIVTVCAEQNCRLSRDFDYPGERMTIVHNTPDAATFSGVRIGSSVPPRLFAYHGSMSAQRGLDVVLEAFARLARRHSDVVLELAGGGEAYEELVTHAHRLVPPAPIRFSGSYEYQQLPELYSRADVGLVTYPLDESVQHTIGNKLFDYMACGKPVIVSPARPLRRIIEETGCGVIAEDFSAEAIAKAMEDLLTSDPSTYSDRGFAAFRQKYNWHRDAATMIDFLATLV